MQQLRELGDVRGARVSRRQAVDPPLSIRPHMQLHPEMPRVPLPRLLHLGIARLRRILRRAGCGDDRRVDDRPALQQQPLRGEQLLDRLEDRRGQPVLLEQVSEAQDRRLVGHHIVPELDAGESSHRLAVVDRILRLRIGEIEPLLQEVDPQHLLEPQRLPSLPGLRIVRPDQREQLRPGNHGVHLGKEALPPRHLALLAPRDAGERPLLTHPPPPDAIARRAPLLPCRATCAELP